MGQFDGCGGETSLSGSKGLDKEIKTEYYQLPTFEKIVEFTSLPLGVNSAQKVFHKRISQNFDGIPQIQIDIDVILTWGQKDRNHDHHLIRCLEKTQKISMTMNINKCHFKRTELVYLGHKLTANGVELDKEKIRSIKGLPVPEDKKAVQQLLGLVDYVGRFISNLSEMTAPLIELLVKNVS